MRREEEEEEEEEKKRRREIKQKGMELWILYGSHGIVRLYMIKCSSPNLGF